MPNCDKCIWSIRSGHCVLLECKFVSYEDARRIMEKKERKDEKTVCSMSMTLEEAIKHAERVAAEQSAKAKTIESNPWGEKSKVRSKIQDCLNCAEEHRQLAEWLKILKSAKFEYDEAWRIITHPTPDVTSYDKDRAQVILDTFRDSLGRMENVDD